MTRFVLSLTPGTGLGAYEVTAQIGVGPSAHTVMTRWRCPLNCGWGRTKSSARSGQAAWVRNYVSG